MPSPTRSHARRCVRSASSLGCGVVTIEIYDTTLRDGAQGVGINFSVSDKLRIAEHLDTLGVTVVEGGWPGANPTDTEFFAAMRTRPLRNATLAAFGATRRAGSATAGRPAVAHAARLDGADGHARRQDLGPARWSTCFARRRDENLAMIADSVRWLVDEGRRVVFDAEHFFDGHASDPDYALRCLDAAVSAGAERVTLCDTRWRHAARPGGDRGARHHRSFRQHRRHSLSRRLGMRRREHPRSRSRRCGAGAGLHQRLRRAHRQREPVHADSEPADQDGHATSSMTSSWRASPRSRAMLPRSPTSHRRCRRRTSARRRSRTRAASTSTR